jgi:hypothetical protein
MKINNRGGLMTTTVDDKEVCLGYMMNFGLGIFTPDSKVDVTPAEMEAHNTALANAEIQGLDEHCQVGQMGTFYYIGGIVKTFTGVVVSNEVKRNGKSITFYRKGKQFRGILQKDADCFNFKRIK